MNAEVAIITPEASPGAGGVADYTLRLVEEWRDRASICLILPEGAKCDDQSELNVLPVERRSDALLDSLPSTGGAVLVQYSAYGFDRYGYPRWLLRALIDWKAKRGGRLVIMFHEIWTFWPVLNKNYLVQQLHRRDIRALVAAADVVFTSTQSQAEHLSSLAGGRRVEVLPVGSNIRPITKPHFEDRQSGVAVLFGLSGTRLRTLEMMRLELFALSENKRLHKIVTIGAVAANTEMDPERVLLNALPLIAGYEQRGELSDEEISELLLTASYGLSAQDQLSVTKSGTLMAYAAHGMNIISPAAAADASEPICWFTSPAELLANVPPEELVERAQRLFDWQQRTASWTVIAEALARALQLPHAVA